MLLAKQSAEMVPSRALVPADANLNPQPGPQTPDPNILKKICMTALSHLQEAHDLAPECIPPLKVVVPEDAGHAWVSEDVGVALHNLVVGEGPVRLRAASVMVVHECLHQEAWQQHHKVVSDMLLKMSKTAACTLALWHTTLHDQPAACWYGPHPQSRLPVSVHLQMTPDTVHHKENSTSLITDLLMV